MKNKLLFLMIGMILLIGMGSVSAYVNIVTDGNITIDGLYKVVNFTGSGTFNTSSINVSILIVGGGGGGGYSPDHRSGAGGGAGGLVYGSVIILGNNNIVVGIGGNSNNNGTNSSFSNFIAIGGGKGGDQSILGSNGGSGGGGGGYASGIGYTNQGNYTGLIGYGNNGTTGVDAAPNYGAGAGGGAGGLGTAGNSTNGGNGGTGKIYLINGTSFCYAGGGGGGSQQGIDGTANCGGGAGNSNGIGYSGINGTGGGGGGGGGAYPNSNVGGRGGNGVIIIRYLISDDTINYAINISSYNSLAYETGTETYSLNLSQSNIPTNAYLVYNGTSYPVTVTGSGENYLLSKTLQIPSSQIGTNTFYYTWNVSSTERVNSSTYTQTISPIQFGLCNATLTIPYMNFTFKDEGSLNFIKASIPSSTFIYYLGDGTINKTYLYTNTTANLNYTFCALPSSQTYYIKTNIQYKNDTSYPQRIFDEVVKAFTNATTNKTLYLLNSAEGIYVTYQVLDAIGNQLSGVQVNVNRTIEGSPYNVGNGLTDSAGSITFWLNPDFIHSLSFSKSGYETFSLAQFPTQSAYTITLGTSTGLGINDYIRGITYTFLPNSGELLNASQLYNFNLTFNSTYWTLDSFGFIFYGDGTVIGGNYSTSSSGGYLENVLNVSSYTHISIKIYWIINGTTIYGINNGWYTYDYEEGTEWSIFNFFKDLKKYAGEGIFGLNQNSLNLIIFLIIFLATGLVSYKFSLTSPAIVTGMIFGLVFLFDVGLGLISVPVGAVKHFPTIFMLLITVALAIWEMRR